MVSSSSPVLDESEYLFIQGPLHLSLVVLNPLDVRSNVSNFLTHFSLEVMSTYTLRDRLSFIFRLISKYVLRSIEVLKSLLGSSLLHVL